MADQQEQLQQPKPFTPDVSLNGVVGEAEERLLAGDHERIFFADAVTRKGQVGGVTVETTRRPFDRYYPGEITDTKVADGDDTVVSRHESEGRGTHSLVYDVETKETDRDGSVTYHAKIAPKADLGRRAFGKPRITGRDKPPMDKPRSGVASGVKVVRTDAQGTRYEHTYVSPDFAKSVGRRAAGRLAERM